MTQTKPTPYFVRECFADNGESDGWAVDKQADGSTFVVCHTEQDAMRVEALGNSHSALLEALEHVTLAMQYLADTNRLPDGYMVQIRHRQSVLDSAALAISTGKELAA
jgi:hypothetical protein